MGPVTRRGALHRSGPIGLVALAGCLGYRPGGSETVSTSESCTPTDPPRPTSAAGTPKSYPDKPDELTTETVDAFVRRYERAYQYNRELADHPDKIGRTNDVDVSLLETVVESDGERFSVELSGQVDVAIVAPTETATESPLPTGHRPFEATYVLTDARLQRGSVVVACW